MIDVVKGVEPETGYGAILSVSETEAAMRECANPANKDRVHVLRRRLQLRYLDEGPPHPQSRAGTRARRTESPPASKGSSHGTS